MALSPNYGFPEPDNSSLVKNGAADIRTLGDSIDTSVWNVGFGQAGKNKFLNGDFAINQRAFTSLTSTATFGFDRWLFQTADGTVTYTPQTFTPGTAPVAGYEAANYARIVTSGQTLTTAETRFSQKIEDVRTFAGQTVTFSFWAKAGSGTPKIALELLQNYGTGGSPSAQTVAYVSSVTISNSWARYSITTTVPALTGKTLGTTANTSFLQPILWLSAGSTYNARTGSLGIQNATIELWGVQVEYGSKATPFQTATGTIQGELAACQRYYWRSGGNIVYQRYGNGSARSSNQVDAVVNFPVTMRTTPTSLDYSNIAVYDGSTVTASTAIVLDQTSPMFGALLVTVASGLTQFRPYSLLSNNTTNAYLGFSAEL